MSVSDEFLSIENLQSLRDSRRIVIDKGKGKFINKELLEFNNKVLYDANNSNMSLSLETFFDFPEEIIDILYEILGYSLSFPSLNKYITCAIFLVDKFIEKDYINHPCFSNNMLYTDKITEGLSLYNKDNRSVLERLSNCEGTSNIHSFIHLRYNISDMGSTCNEEDKDICIYFTNKILIRISDYIKSNIYIDDVLNIFSTLSLIDSTDRLRIVNFILSLKYDRITDIIKNIISIMTINFDIIDKFSGKIFKYIDLMKLIMVKFSKHLYSEASTIIVKHLGMYDKYYVEYLIKIFNVITCRLLTEDMNVLNNVCELCTYVPYFIDKSKSSIIYCYNISRSYDQNKRDIFLLCYLIVGVNCMNIDNGEQYTDTNCSRILNILNNCKNILNNINTRIARYILMRKLLINDVKLRNIINIPLNESIFKTISYENITNRHIKNYQNETIDVHDGNRDLETKNALERLIEIYSTEWDSIDGNLIGFNQFWEYADKKLLGKDRIKFTRVMGVPLTDEKYERDNNDFSPLLLENTTICGTSFIPRNILSYFWYFINKTEYESENLKDTMLKAVLSSFQFKNGKYYCICNPGKLQNLVVYILQGRLTNKDGEVINIDLQTFEDNIITDKDEITPVQCYGLIKPFLDGISVKKCTLEGMFRELFNYIYEMDIIINIDMIIQVVCLYSEANDGFTIKPELSFASCYEGIFDLDDYILAISYNRGINEEIDEEIEID